MNLGKSEEEDMIIMTSNSLGCDKDNIEDIFHLFIQMEQKELITETNVSFFSEVISNQQIRRKIKDYEGMLQTLQYFDIYIFISVYFKTSTFMSFASFYFINDHITMLVTRYHPPRYLE